MLTIHATKSKSNNAKTEVCTRNAEKQTDQKAKPTSKFYVSLIRCSKDQ